MGRPIKDNTGYFNCEGCNFKSKKVSTLSYFKGKLLCRHCRNKSSKAVCNMPKLTISENSLKHIPLTKKELESTKPKRLVIEVDNKFSVSLTKDEYFFFKRKLMKEGLTSYEAHEKIGQLIEVIKSNHSKFKQKDINFTEEFNKLI